MSLDLETIAKEAAEYTPSVFKFEINDFAVLNRDCYPYHRGERVMIDERKYRPNHLPIYWTGIRWVNEFDLTLWFDPANFIK